MTSPLAILAGLGAGASALGQSLQQNKLLAYQQQVQRDQQQRQAAQDALARLVTLQKVGGTQLPADQDPTQALGQLTQANALRSGGAIPNSALGIPDESVPDAYGKPQSIALPGPDGKPINILLDPSKTPEALQERRLSMQQAGVDRRQQTTIQAQTALEHQRETAKTLAGTKAAKASYMTLKSMNPQHPLVQAPFDPDDAANYGAAVQLEGQKQLQASAYHPDAYTFPVVTGPDGKQVLARANTHSGEVTPMDIDAKQGPVGGPGGRGAATIQKAVAVNTQQLAVIDDALKELNAYPAATGLSRGLPVVGDKLDQRLDPAGVAARASIANIGSLQIHDRTGAAMTVHEEPRLAPFVPNVSDTPDAIRTKLQKLKQSIQVETQALQQGAGPAPGGGRGAGPSAGKPLSDVDRAHAQHDPGFAQWLKANGYEVP